MIEESLHSRAVMYGVEHLGWKNDITIRVSSEGVNVNLERMYENVECTMRTAMEIRHCWLPQDLEVESCVDNQPIPFCKQHMTGMELGCIQEVIDGGLDAASKFTFHNMDDYYITFERPYVQEFLTWLFATYNVCVWTARSSILLRKSP